MQSKYDGVLFDFDGVIVDSEPVHFNCWLQVLEPLGFTMTWDWFVANCVGIADTELFDAIASKHPAVTGEQVRELYPAKTAAYREFMKVSPPFAPGLRQLLSDLSHWQILFGLVTSSAKEEVKPILSLAGLNFNPKIFRDDVQFRKPHPEPYLLAASRMEATKILVVEDSEHGANSARAAGLDVLKIANAQELDEKLRAALSAS